MPNVLNVFLFCITVCCLSVTGSKIKFSSVAVSVSNYWARVTAGYSGQTRVIPEGLFIVQTLLN